MLFGKRIVVTRSRSQASKLTARLEQLGAKVIETPAIRLEAPADAYKALDEAIPSRAWLARQLKITRGAVAQWDRVPAERLGEVAAITGVAPTVLRPDIFAPAPSSEQAA